MKNGQTLFLKSVILFLGIAVLAGLIWFPKTEGRAANLDLISIYTDPLILYGYIASIPFFIGLRQAYKLLQDIEQNKVFSNISVKALRNIKYCAIALIMFIAGGQLFIFFNGVEDDKTGPIALGIYTTLICIIVITAASVFERLLTNVVKTKTENDLTV